VSGDGWEVNGIAETKEWKKEPVSKVAMVSFMLKRIIM
jgi:hypothetical protein